MDTLHEDRRTFMLISRRILFFDIRTIPEIYFRGNQTIHIMFNKRFPESVYEKMREKMAESDSPQRVIQWRAEKKRFTCRITKARMQTRTINISHLLLHDRLMPSDLVNCFTATLTKNEKMRNGLYVIKMCLAKLYSKKEHEQKTFFVSAQHRKRYMKTYEGFHFADDTNLPQNIA